MAAEKRDKPTTKRQPRASTPGRPKKKGNEFFEVGKVGRKTGITLEDKGVRDEHGLEPVEHIFSSPVKDSGVELEGNGDVEGGSDELMQESSGLSVNRALTSRKTPRLPPPRASTPRHTNIGSPKRMSTGQRVAQRHVEQDHSATRPRTQPPANRKLDFAGAAAEDTVHKSIESPSPFKPRHALRRSLVGRGDQKDVFGASPSKPGSDAVGGGGEEDVVEVGKIDNEDAAGELDDDRDVVRKIDNEDDAPPLPADDDYYDPIPLEASFEDEEPAAEAGAEDESVLKPRPSGPRKSTGSANNSRLQRSPSGSNHSSSFRKRTRASLQNENSSLIVPEQSLLDAQLDNDTTAPARKKQRGKQDKQVVIHHRDGADETIDPALLACGDQYEPTSALEAELEINTVDDAEAEPEPQPTRKGKGKGKGKAKKVKMSTEQTRERSVKINDSPSKLRNDRDRSTSRQSSLGPMNAYHLRATTPFEDAGERTSRYGRNLIQPLKYWANEARIYRRGEIEGIVRAEEVEVPKKKAGKKGKKRKGIKKLDDIDEESSDTESVQPDEWEDDIGVLAGNVADWNVETQTGDTESLVKEDLAFAAPSIVTRPPNGPSSTFHYAKILTLPFFGSGVVEIPPGGLKRVKNSRKMQQCFFVAEGKVLVEVGAAGTGVGRDNGGKDGDDSFVATVEEERRPTKFALSRGGVWVVPRGNDYAIWNESSTKTARIFFAQGCEIEAPQALEEAQ